MSKADGGGAAHNASIKTTPGKPDDKQAVKADKAAPAAPSKKGSN